MPYHWSNSTPNFWFPDGSGMAFDLPPQNIVNGWGNWMEGGFYDVPKLPRFNADGSWMGWTQWIEKWMKDIRFMSVSDYNAHANIFPEVNDPYMFTEYVAQGLSKKNDLAGADAISTSIITPPWVCPTKVDRSSSPAKFVYLNDQIPTVVQQNEKSIYSYQSKWQSNASGLQFWENQLDSMKWVEVLTDGTTNSKFTRLPIQKRVVYAAAASDNSGVKMYRQQVWSQTLRWGYSQNIPGRIITMTGPKEFYRPTGFFTGKIVPHVEIKTGSPVYDNLSQSANGQQAVFRQTGLVVGLWANTATLTLADVTPTGVDGPPDSVFTYPTTGLTGIAVPLPKLTPNEMTRYQVSEIDFTDGDLVHRGCAFWKGSAGSIHCDYFAKNATSFSGEGSPNPPVTHKKLCATYGGSSTGAARDAYKTAGGQCPYYTPQGQRVLMAYTGTANTAEQLSRLKQITQNPAPGSSGLPGLGGFIADTLIQPLDTSYQGTLSDPNAGVQQTRVVVTYQPEVVSPGAKQSGYKTADGKPAIARYPDDDLDVIPGTGDFPLDEIAQEPFKGVDSPFFGFANQINYRVMQNVQHCYKAENCDSIIKVRGISMGFVRGRYSNVNFKTSPLRMANYPASDGTDSYCHYGNGTCPYNQLDRRAVEYDGSYKILIDEIARPFRASGISGFSGVGLREAFIVNGQIKFYASQTAFTADPDAANAMCVAVGNNTSFAAVCGHWQPIVGDLRIFFYYDTPSWDPAHKSANLSAHLIQFDNDSNPCYLKNIPSQYTTDMSAIFGGTDSIPWIVGLDLDYISPFGNLMMPTNGQPFWGGRSPEYKDHSKRGRVVNSPWGGYKIDVVDPNLMGNQFGGARWNQLPPSDQGTRGYWTQATGEFIIPGTTGIGSPVVPDGSGGFTGYVPVKYRIDNIPQPQNGALPINGVPGLAITNPTDPTLNRNGDFALVGATYSNDTKALLDWFNEVLYTTIDPQSGLPIRWTRWKTMLPIVGQDDQGNELYPPTSPPNGEYKLLPAERYIYRCNVCGTDCTEEEANAIKAKFPLAANPPSGALMMCPRGDGGFMIEQAGMDRILPTCARGYVDVWAAPGTTVRHDSFFWKEPQLISRLTETHITQKLGAYNPTGGGYTFGTLGPDVEKLGRVPASESSTWKQGIGRQVVVPWAAPGDSVQVLRAKVTPWFGLGVFASKGVMDVAYVTPRDGAEVRISPDAESSRILAQDDVVRFKRENLDGTKRAVGLLVNVSSPVTGSLSNEPIVKNDTPKPKSTDYAATEQGIALFQADLREWILNGVTGSDVGWATNLSNPKNALASQLQNAGKNPDLGKPFNPGAKPGSTTPGSGAGPEDLDERVLAPYGQNESSGLKIITMTQMQRLRNRILPALAYVVTDPTSLYTAGGDYTVTKQAGNRARFSTVNKVVPQKTFGTIPVQIMAANQIGQDVYVEWNDPNLETGPARAYYPVGTTWWRTQQKVGNIKRSGGTNPLHLDADPAAVGQDLYNYYLGRGMSPYTGDVVSTASIFLYGTIPMDKEVVAAYAIFTMDDGPTAAALGCKGIDDGFEGQRAPSSYGFPDNLMPGTAVYRGTATCYWQHYHPMKTSHEGDIGSYLHSTVMSAFGSPGYAGYDSRQHWLTGGNQDAGVNWTAADPIQISPPPTLNTDYWWWYWRDEDKARVYDPNVSMIGMSFYDESFGYRFGQPILATWTWGTDIVQNMTEYAVWKEMTYSDYQSVTDLLSVKTMAAVDTSESVLTFDYFSKGFRNNVFTRQQQAIPGWINYTNFDTSGRFDKNIQIETQVTDTSWANGPQVIVQSSGPGGGGGQDQGGNVERVLNITKTVKRLYNDRVPRFYNAKLGLAYASFYDKVRERTDTNVTTADPDGLTQGGLAKRFHSGAPAGGNYAPMYWFNYRYLLQLGDYRAGMWLTDPYHMVALSADQPIAFGQDPVVSDDAVKQARVYECTDWDQQGLDSTDPNYKQHHPFCLCSSDTTTFNETSGTSTRPVPASTNTSYWRSSLKKPATNWFSMDLRQMPYEEWRQPYRYQAPTIDSTNATCPNVTGCWVAAQHLTVGELYNQMMHNLYGGVSIPSTSSPRCVVCNTVLTGVNYLDGDGIVTVAYDAIDNPDVILNAIEIDTATHDGWHEGVKHPFIIEFFNSVAQAWDVLFKVDVNQQNNKFRYQQWDGSNWNLTETDALPLLFKGWEGDHLNTPRNGPSGIHFIVKAAQKIRFKVVQPAFVQDQENGTCTPSGSLRRINVASLHDPLSSYAGRSITITDADGGNPSTFTIVTAAAGDTGVNIDLDGYPVSSNTLFSINWGSYIARCTKFRAYGYPYPTGQIIITPPASSLDFLFNANTTTFTLPEYPTQITSVTVTAGDDPGIVMTECNDPNASDFVWTTTNVTIGTVTYKKITGGKWYFNQTTAMIMVPGSYMDGSIRKSIWTINQALYAGTDPLLIDTQPSKITIRYFTGMGVSVDVPITAYGVGPSYQVDRECICFVANNTPDTDTLPTWVVSDQLPTMGQSVKLVAKNNTRETLSWRCYNDDLVVWEPKIGNLTGDELPQNGWDDLSVLNLYSGNHGTTMSDIGTQGFISGYASGKVTLYGAPGVILSGNLMVYAKAVTTRTWQDQSNNQVSVYERTGGMREGVFVFRLLVDEVVSNARKSISCGVPKIVVYLRERDQTVPIQNNGYELGDPYG